MPTFANEPQVKPPFVEWHAPAPPTQNAPQSWLKWALDAEEAYDEEQQVLNSFYPEMRDRYSKQFFEISKVRDQAIDKLVSFGKPSIKLCVDMLVAHKSPNISYSVLSRIGKPAIVPLLDAIRLHPDETADIEQVFWQYQINPGNELADIAVKRGPNSPAAATVLAFFGEKICGNTADYALGRPDCVDEKYRPLLLARLKGERDAQMRSDLLQAQNFFKSPDIDTIRILISLLGGDADERVRKSAADALGWQLAVLTPKFSGAPEAALARALNTDKAEEVLVAAGGALCSAQGRVSPIVLQALRKRSKSKPYRAQWAANMAIGRLVLANHELIPDITQFLTSKDPSARSQALVSFTQLGPEAVSAVPKLREVIRDNPYGMAPQVTEILKCIYSAKAR